MMFLATINVPGYLPMNDDPPTFDTAQAAWSYLADEREREEEADDFDLDHVEDLSDTYGTLAALAEPAHWENTSLEVGAWLRTLYIEPDGTGVIYGNTPGYDGNHDLGLAYVVSAVH